jgi:hypothetical protein
MELIRMHEAVTLLVWPGMHVVAVTQNAASNDSGVGDLPAVFDPIAVGWPPE